MSERGCDIKGEGGTLGEIELMKTREGDGITHASSIESNIIRAYVRKGKLNRKETRDGEEKEEENVKDETHQYLCQEMHMRTFAAFDSR